PPGRLEGESAGDGDPKLRVQLPRLHVTVGVGFDAGGDPQEDVSGAPHFGGQFVEPHELRLAVHHDPPDSRRQTHTQLVIGFVVAVEVNPFRGETGLEGGVQLAAGNHIEAQTFGRDDAADARGEQRLACVNDLTLGVVACEGAQVLPARGPHPFFVQDVQGCAVPAGEFHGVAAADFEMSSVVDGEMGMQGQGRQLPRSQARTESSYHSRLPGVKEACAHAREVKFLPSLRQGSAAERRTVDGSAVRRAVDGPAIQRLMVVGTNRSTIPMTKAARSAPSTVTCMPGTKNWVAHRTSAEMMNPTSPRPNGDTRLPMVASMTHPSAAMTMAANSALRNPNGAKPGTRNPTNISTSAETTNRTMVPRKSKVFTPLPGVRRSVLLLYSWPSTTKATCTSALYSTMLPRSSTLPVQFRTSTPVMLRMVLAASRTATWAASSQLWGDSPTSSITLTMGMEALPSVALVSRAGGSWG